MRRTAAAGLCPYEGVPSAETTVLAALWLNAVAGLAQRSSPCGKYCAPVGECVLRAPSCWVSGSSSPGPVPTCPAFALQDASCRGLRVELTASHGLVNVRHRDRHRHVTLPVDVPPIHDFIAACVTGSLQLVDATAVVETYAVLAFKSRAGDRRALWAASIALAR